MEKTPLEFVYLKLLKLLFKSETKLCKILSTVPWSLKKNWSDFGFDEALHISFSKQK